MWIDEHPYLSIYLLGCLVALLLQILTYFIYWTLSWITRENILRKNLKKVQEPDKRTLGTKVIVVVVWDAVGVASSWIGVAFQLWQILATLLGVVREIVSSTPEAIKLLRFALKNNPDMSREAVWAYLMAISIKAGRSITSEHELHASLKDVFDYYPSFDRRAAIRQLESLNAVSSDLITSITSVRLRIE